MNHESPLMTEHSEKAQLADGAEPSRGKIAKDTVVSPGQAPTRLLQDRVNKTTIAFGEIVALLSRSSYFRHMSLVDLEWLVIPPLMHNQVSTVRGKVKDQEGLTIPLGLALWARVSEEVDKKLEAQKQANAPFRLAPQEWKSGNIPWLLAVVAPKEVGQALVEKLESTMAKGTSIKRFPVGIDEITMRKESGPKKEESEREEKAT